MADGPMRSIPSLSWVTGRTPTFRRIAMRSAERPLSLKVYALSVVALLFGALFLLLPSACLRKPASPSLPPAAAQTRPDPYFNRLFTRFGDGWTGGDGTLSIGLPNWTIAVVVRGYLSGAGPSGWIAARGQSIDSQLFSGPGQGRIDHPAWWHSAPSKCFSGIAKSGLLVLAR